MAGNHFSYIACIFLLYLIACGDCQSFANEDTVAAQLLKDIDRIHDAYVLTHESGTHESGTQVCFDDDLDRVEAAHESSMVSTPCRPDTQSRHIRSAFCL